MPVRPPRQRHRHEEPPQPRSARQQLIAAIAREQLQVRVRKATTRPTETRRRKKRPHDPGATPRFETASISNMWPQPCLVCEPAPCDFPSPPVRPKPGSRPKRSATSSPSLFAVDTIARSIVRAMKLHGGAERGSIQPPRRASLWLETHPLLAIVAEDCAVIPGNTQRPLPG